MESGPAWDGAGVGGRCWHCVAPTARLAQVAASRYPWQQQGGSLPTCSQALQAALCSPQKQIFAADLIFHWDRWDDDVLAKM